MGIALPPRMVWPKTFPPLTPEQVEINNDFVKAWHEELPAKYGVIEKFNHGFPVRFAPAKSGCRTLEIGAGLGEHIAYENYKDQDYHCVEIRENMAREIERRFPGVKAIVGDCQARLDYPDARFDRMLAIHVLEHLPNLPGALDEAHRLLTPGGVFAVVIPCDPGLAYEFARKISAERLFRKRYKQSYDWFIRREHINSPKEIRTLLEQRFTIERTNFFPLGIPVVDMNLCVGLIARKAG